MQQKKPSNKPTVEQLQADFMQARSAHGTQADKIERWLDILNITNGERIRVPKGKSAMQPRLARRQAEWRYTVLTEPYLSTEDIFRLKPRGPLDREAAIQNQRILNYQFNEQMDKVKFIDTYVRNAVNEGTVIVKVNWRNETKTVKKIRYKYNYLTPTEPQAALIQAGLEMYNKDPASVEKLAPDYAESVLVSVEQQSLIYAEIASKREVEEEVNIVNEPDLEVCDFRNVIVDPTCEGNLEDAQFVIYSYDTDISSLRKAGVYNNLDKLRLDSSASYQDGLHTRLGDDSFMFEDEARKKFTVYEYWGYWDLYNTGETVAIVAAWVDDQLIRCEENPYPHKKIPFVVVPYLPVKNSVYGEPDAELIADNQRIVGALTRGMIDTFAATAAGQKGVAKNALDYLNHIKFMRGENFEFNPMATPDATIWTARQSELPQSAFGMLQLMNNEAASMTGIQAFSSGITGTEYGNTATGIDTAVSAQAKREFGILRRLTEGLKQIAKMILSMNSEWLDDEFVLRVTDEEFVGISRANLTGLFDIELSISTQEMDNAKAQQLAFLLQTTGNTLPFEMTKLVLEDIAELNRMPALANKIKKYEQQPDPTVEIELAKLQLELKEKEIQLAKLQAETQLITERANKEASQTDLNTLEYIHKERGVDHARDLEKQQAQAQGNTKRDAFKAALDAQAANTNKGTTK